MFAYYVPITLIVSAIALIWGLNLIVFPHRHTSSRGGGEVPKGVMIAVLWQLLLFGKRLLLRH